jgi:hypothetical protein
MKKVVREMYALSSPFYNSKDLIIEDIFFETEDLALEYLCDIANNIDRDMIDNEGNLLLLAYCSKNNLNWMDYEFDISLNKDLTIEGNIISFNSINVTIETTSNIIKRFDQKTARQIYPNFMKYSFEIYRKRCILIEED